MRKFCIAFLFLIVAFKCFAFDLPKPQGWVNDYAGVITGQQKEELTALITDLEAKTSAEIMVVTVKSIAPYDEKEYARLIFDNWKPGKKDKDNGIIVLLAVKERRWRIETGYGIEGVLPDGVCGQIGRDYMVPYFKKSEYEQGLYSGVLALAKVIAPDLFKNLPTPVNNNSSETDITWIFGLFIFIIFYTALFLQTRGKKGHYYGGLGGFGGGGGGFGGGGFGGGGGGGGGGSGGGF